MKIEKIIKGSFAVIGKEGSTSDGDGFIQKLWEDANVHFDQISHLAKKDENGNLAGIWGQCLTLRIPLCLGKISGTVSILQAQSV